MRRFLSKGVGAARVLSALCLVLLLVPLAFRAFVYRHMHIAPDAPYGISDLIEYMLAAILVGALALSASVSVILGIMGPRPNRFAGLWLGLIVVAIALLAVPLHGLVSRASF